jgi:DNA-binding GntR family transcriptional regulator
MVTRKRVERLKPDRVLPPEALSLKTSARSEGTFKLRTGSVSGSVADGRKVHLTRRTLQHSIYDYLREGLMSGEYSPGERLTVRGVAAKTGTSVMPVRAAFQHLASEGALEPLSNGAIRVPLFDLHKLLDLEEIRVIVEGLAARRAAQRIDAKGLSTLEELNEDVIKAAKSGDPSAEARANEKFHFCLYRAAQSDTLLRIIEGLWLQVGPYLAWLLKQSGSRDVGGVRGFRYHKDILLAVRRHDMDQAETAIRADLMVSMSAVEMLLKQTRKFPQQKEVAASSRRGKA